MAPLRAFISQELWSRLSQRFLDSGIADSHATERLLLDLHASQLTDTYVYPRAAFPRTLQYHPRSELGQQLLQSVPHVIVQALLDWNVMSDL